MLMGGYWQCWVYWQRWECVSPTACWRRAAAGSPHLRPQSAPSGSSDQHKRGSKTQIPDVPLSLEIVCFALLPCSHFQEWKGDFWGPGRWSTESGQSKRHLLMIKLGGWGFLRLWYLIPAFIPKFGILKNYKIETHVRAEHICIDWHNNCLMLHKTGSAGPPWPVSAESILKFWNETKCNSLRDKARFHF